MDQFNPPLFKVEFTSGPFAVREAMVEILAGLGPLNLDGEELGTVELVLVEALNNVVEHAYPEEDPAGPISVSGMQSDKGLNFQIIDHGRPMPDEEVPMGKQANIDVDMYDLPEGGFGWFLIRDLAKDVQYNRRDDRNILDLRLAVAIPS